MQKTTRNIETILNLDDSPGVKILAKNNQVVSAKNVITCGGLHSDLLAKKLGGKADPPIIPFRGEFLRLKPEFRSMVKGLIYPVSFSSSFSSPLLFLPRIRASVALRCRIPTFLSWEFISQRRLMETSTLVPTLYYPLPARDTVTLTLAPKTSPTSCLSRLLLLLIVVVRFFMFADPLLHPAFLQRFAHLALEAQKIRGSGAHEVPLQIRANQIPAAVHS